jgi:hypothetical protein
MTPTLSSRTQQALESMGYTVAPCDGLDGLGATLLAFHSRQRDVLLVLPAADGTTGRRIAAAMDGAALGAWLRCGARLEVWEWLGPTPRNRREWTAVRRSVGLRDIPTRQAEPGQPGCPRSTTK